MVERENHKGKNLGCQRLESSSAGESSSCLSVLLIPWEYKKVDWDIEWLQNLNHMVFLTKNTEGIERCSARMGSQAITGSVRMASNLLSSRYLRSSLLDSKCAQLENAIPEILLMPL